MNSKCITNLKQEFIFDDDRPFESAHASTVVKMPNGKVLVAWFGGSAEKAPDVAIWSSVNENGVWLPPVIVADVPNIAHWNPVLFVADTGEIMLFYKVGSEISSWKTFIKTSGDCGGTWSAAEELVVGDETGGRGPVKNKPIRLHDGTILAPASVEGESWQAFVDISKDEGKTWSKSELVPVRHANYSVVHLPYEKHRLYGKGVIQPTLWQDGNNEVHMLLRSTSSRIFRSDSKDGGNTWTCAYDTGLPNNNSGLDLDCLPDGTLVLVYNPRENLPNYYKGPRTPLIVSISKDNGVSFEPVLTLETGSGNYSYPAIICTNTNEVFITYTWNREKIAFCSFKLNLKSGR